MRWIERGTIWGSCMLRVRSGRPRQLPARKSNPTGSKTTVEATGDDDCAKYQGGHFRFHRRRAVLRHRPASPVLACADLVQRSGDVTGHSGSIAWCVGRLPASPERNGSPLNTLTEKRRTMSAVRPIVLKSVFEA